MIYIETDEHANQIWSQFSAASKENVDFCEKFVPRATQHKPDSSIMQRAFMSCKSNRN